ncbi:MAG: hypothetical protein AAF800_00340 [Planctomycetota bacterium]
MRARHHPPPNRDRGTVLVLVLAVTSMVGVIGLSSLLATRIEHRGVRDRADAAHAQRLADGALQLLHARLDGDPDWRTDHTHDTWSADETLDADTTLRYRLADEADGDLADEPDDPARLTVRVTHGRAVRLVSVLVGGGSGLDVVRGSYRRELDE